MPGQSLSEISYPDPLSDSAFAFGINDLGQIVGQYDTPNQSTPFNGFIASPVPEPTSIVLLVTMFAILGGLRIAGHLPSRPPA